MAEKELKWYDILAILFGTILNIADPITDNLTVPDPDLEIRGGGRLSRLLDMGGARSPLKIFSTPRGSVWFKNNGGERTPRAPPLDPPLPHSEGVLPADHKTWFGLGLCFIILPLLLFLIIYFAMRFEECGDDCEECKCICVCSPFFPALLKMYEFLVTLKFRTKVSPPGILIHQENPRRIHIGMVLCRPGNSLFWPRPLLNQLLSLLFSCTPWLFNRNR